MSLTRRSLLRTTLGAGVLVAATRRGKSDESSREVYQRLDEIASAPVLRVDAIEKPVKVASMELLRNRAELCRPCAIDRRSRRDRRPQRDAHGSPLPDLLESSRPVFRGKGCPPARAVALGAVPP